MGQDMTNPTPDPDPILLPHIQGREAKGMAAPKPGRETWAPAAAASHAPSMRRFSPFHYMGFLIKTERALFSRK